MATDEKEVPGDIKFYQAEIRAYKRIFEDIDCPLS